MLLQLFAAFDPDIRAGKHTNCGDQKIYDDRYILLVSHNFGRYTRDRDLSGVSLCGKDQQIKTMNKIKHTLLLLAAALLPMSMGAQVINGDLNHNTVLDVGDVTMVIDGYLTGTTEVVGPEVNHYYVDYNMLAGTWYRSKTDSFTLNSDGTTDYGKGYTYKFLPSQGCILFFNSAGRAATYLKVIFLPADKSYLVVKAPSASDVQTYYNISP